MKLLNKEKFLQVPVYVFIFILVGVGFYYVAQIVLHEDVASILKARKRYLVQNIHEINELIEYQRHSFNTFKIENTNLPVTNKDIIYDTLFYNDFEKKYELSTRLIFIISNNNHNYKITLTRALVNSSDWAISIAQVVLLFFIILLLLLSAANAFISKRIWKPFYGILESVSQFKISEPVQVNFPSTNINEFNQLSLVLEKMMEKMKTDYISLKKFSENASHEVQTPLSVIKVKLDILLQSSRLSEDDLQLVTSALQSVKKLSKLSEALLTLTKIENRQYVGVKNMDLKNVIRDKVDNLIELINLKNIQINLELTHSFMVKIDPVLADLLIENLISNAIRHNYENGKINIRSKNNKIIIENTGHVLNVPTDNLFKRFSKATLNSSSLGLGLAIVKEICLASELEISYQNNHNIHVTTLIQTKDLFKQARTDNKILPSYT